MLSSSATRMVSTWPGGAAASLRRSAQDPIRRTLARGPADRVGAVHGRTDPSLGVAAVAVPTRQVELHVDVPLILPCSVHGTLRRVAPPVRYRSRRDEFASRATKCRRRVRPQLHRPFGPNVVRVVVRRCGPVAAASDVLLGSDDGRAGLTPVRRTGSPMPRAVAIQRGAFGSSSIFRRMRRTCSVTVEQPCHSSVDAQTRSSSS